MADSTLVSLTDIKTHLRYPNPSQASPDDAALQRFLNAADEVLQYECDETLPRTYTERHDGGDYTLFTYHRPLISVRNIEEGWGWINFELDFQDANTAPENTTLWGYSIDSPENGQISRRSVASVPIPFMPGEANIVVTYVAGHSPLPATIVLACLELISHWWQNSQLRAAVVGGANVAYDATQGTAYTRDTEAGVQNLNIGVPYRILEMIKSHRHMPFIA